LRLATKFILFAPCEQETYVYRIIIGQGLKAKNKN